MTSTVHLVDTNVLSELARPRPNARVVAWARTVARVSLSVITLEEIQFGLAWRPNARIQSWFDTFVRDHCEIRPVTAEIAVAAGQMRGRLAVRGAARSLAWKGCTTGVGGTSANRFRQRACSVTTDGLRRGRCWIRLMALPTSFRAISSS